MRRPMRRLGLIEHLPMIGLILLIAIILIIALIVFSNIRKRKVVHQILD